ncbi:hypothetical protein [Rhodoferax sp. AJA081-3]|uniref:hypothetical protein n=1 Tax=Rhodoferax sp. AJA081-3 TaxID=2752316 RepID=UPI001FD79567|nr:hypothetical protein [Rhodoferax sp. AJA081-3]
MVAIPCADTHGCYFQARCNIGFYSSRDTHNLSRIGRLDVDAKDPSKIMARHDAPVMELGEPGTFDDSGMMPSSIVKVGDRIFLYYIGWNVRNTVPYHNSVGLAVSDDGASLSSAHLTDR